MKIIDATGMKCPQPLILVKKTLREILDGESFKLITMSNNAHNNIKCFLDDNDVKYEVGEKEGKYIFSIIRSGSSSSSTKPEEYCNPGPGE